MLTDCGVGGDPALLEAWAQVVERQLNTVLGLFVGHSELSTTNRLLREVGSSLLAGNGLGSSDT